MEYIDSFIEWFENEDLFILKYGLVISNFVTILFLLALKSRNRKTSRVEGEDNVLLVTAHPDDEAMFFLPTI